MADYPNFPVWTDALIGDTQHMNAEQFGAYFMLLVVAWRSPDNSLPVDDKQLCRIARLSKSKWLKNKSLIMALWTVDEGRYRQKRLDKVKNLVTKNVQQKKRAQEAKTLKYNESKSAAASAETPSRARNQNQNQNQVEVEGKPSTPEPTPEPPLFDQFFNLFPKQRKDTRTKTLTAYVKALERATQENIHEGLIRYAGSDEVARKFAKGSVAWLNGDRWTHEYQPADAQKSVNGRSNYGDSVANAARAVADNIGNRPDLWPKDH